MTLFSISTRPDPALSSQTLSSPPQCSIPSSLSSLHSPPLPPPPNFLLPAASPPCPSPLAGRPLRLPLLLLLLTPRLLPRARAFRRELWCLLRRAAACLRPLFRRLRDAGALPRVRPSARAAAAPAVRQGRGRPAGATAGAGARLSLPSLPLSLSKKNAHPLTSNHPAMLKPSEWP